MAGAKSPATAHNRQEDGDVTSRVNEQTQPLRLRDGRGYLWHRRTDGDYVMEGDSPRYSHTLSELRSAQFAAVIGEVQAAD